MKIVIFFSMFLAIVYADLIVDDFPNNAYQDTQEISFISDVTGTIEVIDDEDWFKFVLLNDDGIIINLNKGVGYPIKLNLYTKNEAQNQSLQKDVLVSEYFPDSYSKNKQIKLNLTKGTYYIKIYGFDNSEINTYNFNIRINGDNEPDIVTDALTMQYCKNNPSECGIVTSYNNSEFYSQDDINKIIQDTNTTTIEYCKSNPSSCGIAIPEVVDESTLDNYLFENNTWHLLDYEALLILLSSFDKENANAIKAIWSYSDGQWSAYSFDESILENIKKSNINILDKIEKKKGYWALINGDNPAHISYTSSLAPFTTKEFYGYGKFDVSSSIFEYFGNEINISNIYSSNMMVEEASPSN